MTIRPLDLLDLPLIYRCRSDVLVLDSARTLMRGNPLGTVGFLAYFNPARHIYNAVVDGDETALLGGIINSRGETFAKLLYLAPASHLVQPALPGLLENLAAEAGSWGVLHVIAEVDESSEIFPVLRQSGFSVYAWQRMWDISAIGAKGVMPDSWRRAQSSDQLAVQNLYCQIVPPLLQPVEPLSKRSQGLICDGEIRCYIGIAAGVYGIVLTPLIHPEASQVEDKLTSLQPHLPDWGGRPVYLRMRSYQAWLEPVLEDLGAKAAARQAVMVKHLTRPVKDEQTVPTVSSQVSVQPSRVSQLENKK